MSAACKEQALNAGPFISTLKNKNLQTFLLRVIILSRAIPQNVIETDRASTSYVLNDYTFV